MKRYRLKKFIPGAPEGTIFQVDNKGRMTCEHDLWEHVVPELPVFKEWFEEVEEESSPFRYGQYCWVILAPGDIKSVPWFDDKDDRRALAMHNVFATKEEAEAEVEWRKARHILLGDMKEFKPDWKNKRQDKVYVRYDPTIGRYGTNLSNYDQIGTIYFKNWDDAKESLRKHKREWAVYLGGGG